MRRAASLAIKILNHAAGTVERLTLWDSHSAGELPYRPIFIVGAPRCGSTLFYQAFLQYFDVGYFANIHHRFYMAPAVVERLTRATRRYRTETFQSHYGATGGWNSPSENWQFWYRFFRRTPQHVSLAEADPAKLVHLRKAMAAFSIACGRPVASKNLPIALRLEPLNKALPEALFIVVRRDLAEIAKSLLTGRMRKFGTYDAWWSLEPPNIDKLRRLPPQEQVVEQARSIYSLIEYEKQRLGTERFLDVSYEDFCGDTHAALQSVDAFLKENGTELARRTGVPKSFERSKLSRLEPEMCRAVDAYLRNCGIEAVHH